MELAFALAQLTQSFGDGEGSTAIVESASNGEIVAQ